MEQNQATDSDDWGEAPEGVSPEIWDSWKQWKMKPPADFLYQLGRGIEGRNIGLGNGLTQINKYIHGTHQARYYLIGADAGVGKTTVADFMFILKGWEDAKRQGRKIRIFYCSFEIGKTDKMARWVSYYLFTMYNLVVPSDYILGRITGKLVSKEHHKLILAAYTKVQEMMEDIVFIEDTLHPTGIFEGMIEGWYEKQGTVIRSELSPEQKLKHKKGYVKGFIANDPDMTTMLVIDHMALAGSEQGLDTKHTMDRLSKYMIVLRNIFHTTGIIIQQFSTDLMSWHRSNKKSVDAIAPQRIDFGDSKATYRDADVVIGLTKPFMLDFENFKGYTLISTTETAIGQYFIACYLMKNRYGAAVKCIPLFLNPISGYVYDLPLTPENVMAMQPWQEMAKKLDKIILEYS